MRQFTLVQDMEMDVAEHWRRFFDDAFERALYLEYMGFLGYELLETRQTEAEMTRRVRVVPRLEAPAPVRKALGSTFAYTEDGTFDRKAQVWRLRMTPSVFADRMTSTATVRAEATTPGRCRRTIECRLEARIFGLGGLIESALEKNVRSGWEKSARFMNDWVKR